MKKCIIPAAGLGTRFLPATKTVPKEMLTIVDAPIILYVIEEAIEAGIEEIILITGPNKRAVEVFFDPAPELEAILEKGNKLHLLNRVQQVRERARIISVRQDVALGLGHAVLCGQEAIGKEPFAVLLGDEITQTYKGNPNTTQQLCDAYRETGISSVSIMKVSDSDVSKYGIAEGVFANGKLQISKLMEKPTAAETSSRWALTGRYAFSNEIFDHIKNIKPATGKEIQLTEAMAALCAEKSMIAYELKSQRYDAGDKLGFLMANIEIGLQNPEISSGLRNYLKQRMRELQQEESQ